MANANKGIEEGLGVSVIVPVYNSAAYLSAMLSSVLADESDSFELLLVDDGSTDKSGEICDEFAKKDYRVRVIHKTNGGMCSARNVGIASAKGEYVAFADNDDRVLPGFVTDNYQVAKKYDADCVRFGRVLEQYDDDGNLQTRETSCPPELRVFGREQIEADFSQLRYGTDGVWAGLYRRALLIDNEVRFDESFRSGYEDVLFNDMVYRFAQTYVWNPQTYYCWLKRGGHSTSAKVTDNFIESCRKTFRYEYDLMKDLGNDELRPACYSDRFVSMATNCIATPHYFGPSSKKEIVENYKVFRELLKPYERELGVPCTKLKHEIVRRLLLGRHYHLLYSYLQLALALQNYYRRR